MLIAPSAAQVEMITYNADFAIFGVVTFQFIWDLGGSIQWDYQYNTAELLPYRFLLTLPDVHAPCLARVTPVQCPDFA